MSPREPPARRSESTDVPSELHATPAMCYHCFDVLLDELKIFKKNSHAENNSLWIASPPAFLEDLPEKPAKCPLFVTWEKRKTRCEDDMNDDRYELRGCIGTLSPRSVATAVGEYAVISAMRDRRFSPISKREISQLRVSVSLLVQYEDCNHVHDWTVGLHGIMICWWDKASSSEFSATYLPEVATDQNWDQDVAVRSLIHKAGYHGSINAELLAKIKCTRYQSSKICITFQDYMKVRGDDCSSFASVLRPQSFATSSSEDTTTHNCNIM